MKYEIKEVEIIDELSPAGDSPQIVQCHVEIGDRGSSKADIFFVDVCNPCWAEHHLDREVPDQSILIVPRINENNIRKGIEEKFLYRDYGSFDELVRRATPLMRWEFS